MTTTLIVLAHPDRRSFNGAWANATERAATSLGHEVLTSDLRAMGFDPLDAPDQYRDWDQSRPFDPLKAHEEAVRSATLPADVQAEMDKVRRADRIVFHFPIWWFAPPAILKGWLDRALVHGGLHSIDKRFDTGMCKAKTALFCATTGSSEAESAFNGKEGDIQMHLWPTAYTLRYLGFSVLAPITVHGVHGYHQGEAKVGLETRLRGVLEAQNGVMASWDSHPHLQFNSDDDFDTGGRLRPDRPSYSPFIRQAK